MNDLAVEVAPPQAAHPTTARKVTFFEDRAEIVRSARAERSEGWLSFAGVTPFIDERSLQVRVVEGRGRVLAARVKRRVHHEETLGREELDALEAQLRSASQRLQDANDAAERARVRGEGVRELLGRWAQGLSSVPRGLRKGAADGGWRKAYDALAASEAEVLAAAEAARAACAKAQDDVAYAELRLWEGRQRHVRHEALVQVRAELEDEQVELELVYRTPGALWRPEHVARVEGASMELLTWATVWQRTGEDWRDVEVYLSTARPAHHATPPLLDDDRIVTRRKSDLDRRRTVVEAREQEILSVSVAEGGRVVEQMPGVDDGGTPLAYRASARAHLVSDGRPARLEISRVRLPVRVDRVVYPELSRAGHLRATATLSEGGPLLAGPVHVHYAGTAAGRVKTRFVGKGDAFELGVGTDDAIRVRREVESEDDTSAILGTQRRKRTVGVWLSNLARESKRVRVHERIPVSEIEGLEVDVPPGQPWAIDPRDGFAIQEVELAGNETRKLTLIYELRAPSKMVLPYF